MPTKPTEQEVPDVDTLVQEPARVILFNDEVHTFDEVITQIMKALRCTESKAEGLAWEAHTQGKTMVYSGELVRCVEISGILEEIRLMTQIEV